MVQFARGTWELLSKTWLIVGIYDNKMSLNGDFGSLPSPYRVWPIDWEAAELYTLLN